MLVSYQCCVDQLKRAATGETVKIHFVGYSSRYNEWRSVSELVDKAVEVDQHEDAFFFHQELAYRIKSNISCSRKSSPEVRIELLFDKRVSDEGLLVIRVLPSIGHNSFLHSPTNTSISGGILPHHRSKTLYYCKLWRLLKNFLFQSTRDC